MEERVGSEVEEEQEGAIEIETGVEEKCGMVGWGKRVVEREWAGERVSGA